MKHPLRKLPPANLGELRQIVDDASEARLVALGRPSDGDVTQSR